MQSLFKTDRRLPAPAMQAAAGAPWRRAGLAGASGQAAVAAIGVYQRYVSPYKGYCCAWRVHTGGPSCSAWGRRVMGRFGVVVGWALLMRQFRRCQAAAAALRLRSLVTVSTSKDGDEQVEKPNDPVVSEACPLWSKGAAQWLLRSRSVESAACCLLIGSS